jgi:hypothetical protein
MAKYSSIRNEDGIVLPGDLPRLWPIDDSRMGSVTFRTPSGSSQDAKWELRSGEVGASAGRLARTGRPLTRSGARLKVAGRGLGALQRSTGRTRDSARRARTASRSDLEAVCSHLNAKWELPDGACTSPIRGNPEIGSERTQGTQRRHVGPRLDLCDLCVPLRLKFRNSRAESAGLLLP